MKVVAWTALVLFIVWAALWVWTNYTASGRIDACLDRGGAWNYEQSKCQGARSLP